MPKETCTIQIQIHGIDSLDAVTLRKDVAALVEAYIPEEELVANSTLRIGNVKPPKAFPHPSKETPTPS